MKKTFIILCAITIVFIIVLKFLYHPQTPIQDTEHNKIIEKVISPNGKKVAIAFVRDFGATTDFSTQVSILKESDNFYDDPGNTFRANYNGVIDIKWKDDENIIISYSCDDENILLKKVNNISTHIAYKKIAP